VTQLQVLAPTTNLTPAQIALDDAFVYWGEINAIWRVSKKGGKPEVVGPRTFLTTPWPLMQIFALDASNVYYTDDALRVVPKDGGAPAPLGLEMTIGLVALGGERVYAWEWHGN